MEVFTAESRTQPSVQEKEKEQQNAESKKPEKAIASDYAAEPLTKIIAGHMETLLEKQNAGMAKSFSLQSSVQSIEEAAQEIQLEPAYPPQEVLDASEARGMLIALREEVLRKNPDLSRDSGLLKKSNLELIIYYKPENEKDMNRHIRLSKIDQVWRECLPTVFEITRRLGKRTT